MNCPVKRQEVYFIYGLLFTGLHCPCEPVIVHSRVPHASGIIKRFQVLPQSTSPPPAAAHHSATLPLPTNEVEFTKVGVVMIGKTFSGTPPRPAKPPLLARQISNRAVSFFCAYPAQPSPVQVSSPSPSPPKLPTYHSLPLPLTTSVICDL